MNPDITADRPAVFAIKRPAPSLMNYYVLSSFIAGPFFFIPLIILYFRYHTLRYRFDDEGISMRWGILSRREINLTYARIQDIHLRSNFAERWLNLARIEVQTASGSSGAEMTLEGLHEFEAIRDFLYDRMRGGSGGSNEDVPASGRLATGAIDQSVALQLTEMLQGVTAELKAIRGVLENQDD